jgi:hypothetical protein
MNLELIKEVLTNWAKYLVACVSNKHIRRILYLYLIVISVVFILGYEPLYGILDERLSIGILKPYLAGILLLVCGMLLSEFVLESFTYMYRRHVIWGDMTAQELEFLSYYISNNTRIRYVAVFNGTYKDSGVIELLVRKRIIYLASTLSEFRSDGYHSATQQFPFNIYPGAYKFFRKKIKSK